MLCSIKALPGWFFWPVGNSSEVFSLGYGGRVPSITSVSLHWIPLGMKLTPICCNHHCIAQVTSSSIQPVTLICFRVCLCSWVVAITRHCYNWLAWLPCKIGVYYSYRCYPYRTVTPRKGLQLTAPAAADALGQLVPRLKGALFVSSPSPPFPQRQFNIGSGQATCGNCKKYLFYAISFGRWRLKRRRKESELELESEALNLK